MSELNKEDANLLEMCEVRDQIPNLNLIDPSSLNASNHSQGLVYTQHILSNVIEFLKLKVKSPVMNQPIVSDIDFKLLGECNQIMNEILNLKIKESNMIMTVKRKINEELLKMQNQIETLNEESKELELPSEDEIKLKNEMNKCLENCTEKEFALLLNHFDNTQDPLELQVIIFLAMILECQTDQNCITPEIIHNMLKNTKITKQRMKSYNGEKLFKKEFYYFILNSTSVNLIDIENYHTKYGHLTFLSKWLINACEFSLCKVLIAELKLKKANHLKQYNEVITLKKSMEERSELIKTLLAEVKINISDSNHFFEIVQEIAKLVNEGKLNATKNSLLNWNLEKLNNKLQEENDEIKELYKIFLENKPSNFPLKSTRLNYEYPSNIKCKCPKYCGLYGT